MIVTQTISPSCRKMKTNLVISKLEKLYLRTGSWQKLANSLGLEKSKGVIYSVAKGKRRPTPSICKALGIEYEVMAPAPVCPKHGVVHPGRCPRARKTPAEQQATQAERERRKLAAMVRQYNG